MKVKGKLEHRDLEGGVWQLAAEGGQRYTLQNVSAELKRAKGQKVEIDGSLDEGGFGLAMAGPTLRVGSFRVL
jgi:hypothetical protein